MPAVPDSLAREPLGLAFEISDLQLAAAFAASAALRMVVETNHHTDCDELEEVLALYQGDLHQGDQGPCHYLIWRSAAAVVVQPMPGRPRNFDRLSDALEWLKPEDKVMTSDIIVGVDPRRARASSATAPHIGTWPESREPRTPPVQLDSGWQRPRDELEGDLIAWRNLLWDSVRMLHAGRPDLASRFRRAANEVEQYLRSGREDRRPGMATS